MLFDCKYIAHRGLHNIEEGIPENSMMAFKLAVEQGYGIELDVLLTDDGEVMVFHDKSLSRICGLDQYIYDTPYEVVKDLKLSGTDEGIPRFKDVLDMIDGRVPIVVELKTPHKVGMLETPVLEILKMYEGEYAIESFNPLSVKWFKKHAPNITRGQLSYDYIESGMSKGRQKIFANMKWNWMTKPHFVAYDINAMPNQAVDKAKAKNIPIMAWTVTNDEQLEKALDYCDYVIFEKIRPINKTSK